MIFLQILAGVMLLSLASVQIIHTFYAIGFLRVYRKNMGIAGVEEKNNDTFPKIRASVIIPEKDEDLDILKRSIESSARLKWDREFLEIILVADDSRDRRTLIEDLVDMISRDTKTKIITIYREKPAGGRNGAINEAIARSSGEIIAIVDADTTLSQDFLLRAYEKMISEKCDAVVGRWIGRSYFRSRIGYALTASTTFIQTLLYYGRSSWGFYIVPLGSGTVFRREIFSNIGPIDHDIVQDDYWIGIKMFRSGLKTCYEDNALVEVLVPSTYTAFKVQQSRWAYGAMQAVLRGFKLIIRARDSIVRKLELILYALQYIPALVLLIITPLFYLSYAVIRPSEDPVLQVSSLLYLWIASSILYVAFYIAILKIRAGAPILRSLKWLGTSSATSSVLTPVLGLSQLKALANPKRYRYKVTPKGDSEKMRTRIKDLIPEILFSLVVFIGFTASIVLHHIGVFIVSGAMLASYLYVAFSVGSSSI
ncbi:MAG: glycosyltransferase family 2 protein [Sulfolobales archaeon]